MSTESSTGAGTQVPGTEAPPADTAPSTGEQVTDIVGEQIPPAPETPPDPPPAQPEATTALSPNAPPVPRETQQAMPPAQPDPVASPPEPEEEETPDSYADGAENMKAAVKRLREAEAGVASVRAQQVEMNANFTESKVNVQAAHDQAVATLADDETAAVAALAAAKQNARVALRAQKALLNELEAELGPGPAETLVPRQAQ